MAPERTITGPHAHYRANSGLAPRPATDGPQRGEYSSAARRAGIVAEMGLFKSDLCKSGLTIVFTALAIARFLQNVTGFSTRKIIRTLRPLQDVTISLAGQQITAKPELTDDARHVLDALTH